MLKCSVNRCVFSRRLIAVPAKIRISQAVWQRVPKRRTGHREGPWTEYAEPASRNHQETPSSGSKMLPCWDVGHWYTEVWKPHMSPRPRCASDRAGVRPTSQPKPSRTDFVLQPYVALVCRFNGLHLQWSIQVQYMGYYSFPDHEERESWVVHYCKYN